MYRRRSCLRLERCRLSSCEIVGLAWFETNTTTTTMNEIVSIDVDDAHAMMSLLWLW